MFHGSKDINGDVDQDRRMQNRLENAGNPSALGVFEDLDHSLNHSAARADLLERSDAFLRSALGLPALGRSGAGYEAGRSTRNSTAAETAPRTPNFPGAATPEEARGVDDEPQSEE